MSPHSCMASYNTVSPACACCVWLGLRLGDRKESERERLGILESEKSKQCNVPSSKGPLDVSPHKRQPCVVGPKVMQLLVTTYPAPSSKNIMIDILSTSPSSSRSAPTGSCYATDHAGSTQAFQGKTMSRPQQHSLHYLHIVSHSQPWPSSPESLPTTFPCSQS